MINDKGKIVINLEKAKSLITTVERMVEEEEYCPKIMQQLLAIIGLLKSAHRQLMVKHLRSCFVDAARSANKKRQEQMIDEILKVVELYNKK